jgi:hypothetical protein
MHKKIQLFQQKHLASLRKICLRDLACLPIPPGRNGIPACGIRFPNRNGKTMTEKTEPDELVKEKENGERKR